LHGEITHPPFPPFATTSLSPLSPLPKIPLFPHTDVARFARFPFKGMVRQSFLSIQALCAHFPSSPFGGGLVSPSFLNANCRIAAALPHSPSEAAHNPVFTNRHNKISCPSFLFFFAPFYFSLREVTPRCPGPFELFLFPSHFSLFSYSLLLLLSSRSFSITPLFLHLCRVPPSFALKSAPFPSHNQENPVGMPRLPLLLSLGVDLTASFFPLP